MNSARNTMESDEIDVVKVVGEAAGVGVEEAKQIVEAIADGDDFNKYEASKHPVPPMKKTDKVYDPNAPKQS